ncbi:peptidoglycan DD-metalloendopeptidase family protein [Candidatus Peregrinibacteria bacterium]|nr:peptidoglycan DD-metalloendopeptidase family protein [Candidatus Peregrinibacteria bacterium]
MRILKGLTRFFCFIAVFALVVQVSQNYNVFADDAPIIEATNESQESEKVPVISEQERKNQLLLIQIRKNLQNARNEYFQISSSIDAAKQKLLQVTETITSLKNQIKNLEYLINNTQEKIRNVEKQIAQKENQIQVLKQDIDIKRIELENQKLLLKEYLKLLYVQENSFYDAGGEANISVTKLLLADASVGNTLQGIQYYTILEQTGQNIFNNIEETKLAFERNNRLLNLTQVKLDRLKTQLTEEKRTIQLQRNAKEKLLAQTKGEEEIYRELIAQSKQEQLALIAEINALKNNLGFIQQKITEDGENFNPDNYTNLINPNVRAVYDFEMNDSISGDAIMAWPVKPVNGISAYFHDSSYLATFGIPHNAIDIPVMQGSPVHAPLAGVVYKVKDNGDNSYSYIILAHKGGLLTVYGHMSEVLVKERDLLLPGEIIGLSGGIPGTKGAGYLTTGAHLHFEVIKNGVHIDPLFVLPLAELSEDYLPSYLKEFVENSDEPL